MNVANREWFVDQAKPVIEPVTIGERTVFVRSLDLLAKGLVSARAAKASTVDEVMDQDLFAVENAVGLMAASIVDEAGTRIFGDSEEDYSIIKSMRSKVGDVIDKKVQELSFADREKVSAKN